ncbi:hypothetical protein [Saccharibacillus sacchari]|uniref:Uncharacterized protein n=1 Tax=Saccharibacillus sacchari TaxID=456493 RepID=A0ACC6PHQ1_9BACL
MLTGCGDSVAIDQATVNAYRNLIEANSYAFEAKIQAFSQTESPDIPAEGINDLRTASEYITPLVILLGKEIEIDVQGVYDANRKLIEAEVAFVADSPEFSIVLHSVIVITEEHTWIKIPENLASISGRPEIGGKYYDLGYGYKWNNKSADMGNLGEKVLTIATEDFSGIALNSISVEEADIPDRIKVSSAGRFSISEDNLESVLKAAFMQTVPDMLDLLGDPEWRSALHIDEQELAWKKEYYAGATEDGIKRESEEIKSSTAIRRADLDLGMDKSGKLSYVGANVDFKVVQGEENVDVRGTLTTRISGYNDKQALRYGIPKVNEVILD